MEYYNNILAVEARELVDVGIFSWANYKRLANNGHLRVIRRGCRNVVALVDFVSMPDQYKESYAKAKNVKSVYSLLQNNVIADRIKHDTAISEFYETHLLPDGRHLKPATQREYYANAIILNAIDIYLALRKGKRGTMGHKSSRSWEFIAQKVEDLDRDQYPHSLPNNPRRLEDKYRKYKAEGLEGLIHKNFLNKSAAKVDDDIKASVMIELLADPRNLNDEQVRGLYNMVADKMGWKKISRATVAVWREKYDIEIYAGRRGSVALSNNKAMQVKRQAPAYPLYLWTLDGWDVELMYQETTTNKKGHSVTTYTNRPTVVVVLDACCKYPIGYAVGTHETPELTKAALRNAAHHTAELFGSMYRTQQIQSDRYAFNALKDYYAGVAERVIPARAKNAKAKIIEPYFNQINRKYCQLMGNWSGFGITSDKNKQPNTEFLNKYKNMFPDFEGVCRQVAMIIERERTDKVEQYKALYNEMPEQHKISLSTESYLLQFGETTGHRNLLQGSGLKITINGVKRDYDCFDINFRRHSSTRWEIRYDPDNLGCVLAVNEDQSLRFILEEKYIQPMALIERKEDDYKQLQRVNDYNEQLAEHITEVRAIAGEKTRGILDGVRAIDTLQKLMITDSNGQHKDRRNDQRALPPLETATEEQEDIFDRY